VPRGGDGYQKAYCASIPVRNVILDTGAADFAYRTAVIARESLSQGSVSAVSCVGVGSGSARWTEEELKRLELGIAGGFARGCHDAGIAQFCLLSAVASTARSPFITYSEEPSANATVALEPESVEGSVPVTLKINGRYGCVSIRVLASRRNGFWIMTALSLKAFKRAASVEMSTWYKGILTSQLATDEETSGLFDIVASNMCFSSKPHPTWFQDPVS
jgi:hypothetical protein